MTTAFVCPVCELPLLAAPPEYGPVCPACGTEFEVDDRYLSHEELRHDWLQLGAPWFSSIEPPPENWQEHRDALLAHRDPSATVRVDPVPVPALGWIAVEALGLRVA
jgi:hypothetical protein